jgi:hypothetical protein
MIAGLWDDLRTDRRAGDDVYVVKPDANRVIFRWQTVTYDTPYSATASRGENPVNFEIELNKNGVIKVRYGAGNQKLWPVVGISGGAPDAWPVMSHTSESAFKSLASAQTVIFTPRPKTPPPSNVNISSVTVTPNPVVAGKTATGKVTLTAPAPAGGAVISLSDDLAATTMPASITVAAGTTTKTFSITTANVGSTAQSGTVRAASGASVATTALTVQPLALNSVVLSPTTAVGGNNVTGTVNLNGPAPAGGIVVALSDNLAATTVPASVTVAAGANKATFTIKTTVVTVKQTGTVTATMNGASKTAALAVRPIGVLSVSVTPNPVKGGSSMTGTVTLERPAPSNMTVTLRDSLTTATTPASVVVPAGQTSKTFTVTTTAVTATQKGTVTATLNGIAKSVVFTINP